MSGKTADRISDIELSPGLQTQRPVFLPHAFEDQLGPPPDNVVIPFRRECEAEVA
jgi:hypothetical protein